MFATFCLLSMINPLAKAPKRKYFMAASSDSSLGLAKPARTYRGIESSSSARKITIKSAARAIKIMPLMENISMT